MGRRSGSRSSRSPLTSAPAASGSPPAPGGSPCLVRPLPTLRRQPQLQQDQCSARWLPWGHRRTRWRSSSGRPCAPPSGDPLGHGASLQQRARPPCLLSLFPGPWPHPAEYLGFFGASRRESGSESLSPAVLCPIKQFVLLTINIRRLRHRKQKSKLSQMPKIKMDVPCERLKHYNTGVIKTGRCHRPRHPSPAPPEQSTFIYPSRFYSLLEKGRD